ncbi:hypothetical protein Tco_1284405 [Tanacetum coccineum]
MAEVARSLKEDFGGKLEVVEAMVEEKSNDGLGGGGFVVGGRSSSVSKSVCREVRGVENKSLVGSKLMASGEECLDGWVGAGGGEVKGGGVVFGVSKILLGVIPEDIIRESGGEAFGLD